jgi:hypothetical protein
LSTSNTKLLLDEDDIEVLFKNRSSGQNIDQIGSSYFGFAAGLNACFQKLRESRVNSVLIYLKFSRDNTSAAGSGGLGQLLTVPPVFYPGFLGREYLHFHQIVDD